MKKHRVSLTYHEVDSLVFILLIARQEKDFDKRMKGCGIDLVDLFKRFHSARETIESKGNIK